MSYKLYIISDDTHHTSAVSLQQKTQASRCWCVLLNPRPLLYSDHKSHVCIAMKNTKNVFFFSFKSCRTNCLCYCVVDLLRCPALLPPLLTKHINYVTWETVSDANSYSVIFYFVFLTLHSFISHTHRLIVILLKKAKNKQTNKQSESHFFRCLWVYPLLLGNQEKWMTVRMWGQTVLIPPSRRDEAESGDVLLAEMNYSCGIGLWYPRWHFSTLPLCSHFLCSGKKKRERE